MDDLERVRDNTDGQELLAVVTTLHHQAIRVPIFAYARCMRPKVINEPVNQPLNDGHLRLLELLLGITARGVGEVDRVADLNVVGQGDVFDLNTTRSDVV